MYHIGLNERSYQDVFKVCATRMHAWSETLTYTTGQSSCR